MERTANGADGELPKTGRRLDGGYWSGYTSFWELERNPGRRRDADQTNMSAKIALAWPVDCFVAPGLCRDDRRGRTCELRPSSEYSTHLR